MKHGNLAQIFTIRNCKAVTFAIHEGSDKGLTLKQSALCCPTELPLALAHEAIMISNE